MPCSGFPCFTESDPITSYPITKLECCLTAEYNNRRSDQSNLLIVTGDKREIYTIRSDDTGRFPPWLTNQELLKSYGTFYACSSRNTLSYSA